MFARAAPVAIMVAHYVGLRRVFGGSRLQTAWKGTVIWIAYTVLVLAVMVAIGLRSIREVTPESHADATAGAVAGGSVR